MKAIILAAGYATRLYPLTENKPKALLPIGGKPIIDHIVSAISEIPEITRIYVVSNHKFARQFEEWAVGKEQVTILNDGTHSEETRLGAIGDIQFALKEADIQEDILVMAGDNFFTYRLEDFIAHYHRVQKDCVCVSEVKDIQALKQFGVAVINENQILLDVEEKPENPKSSLAIFATYIYQKETLPLFARYLAEGNKPDAPGYFVQWLYTQKEVSAYSFQGQCYDIGTPASYQAVLAQYS